MSINTSVTLFDRFPMVWPGTADTRQTDPLTSHAARDSITEDARHFSRDAVLLAVMSAKSAAAWQVELSLPAWSPSRVRTALSELVKDGRLTRYAGLGVTPRGRRCDIFEVTR